MRRLLGFDKKIGFCTVASRNFLPMAAVLIDSIRSIYGQRRDVHLLIPSAERIPFDYKGVEVAYAPDLPNAYFWDKVLRYDAAGLGLSFKPDFVRHLHSLHRYDVLIYVDADVELFGRLDELEAFMRRDHAAILLSPHAMQPRALGRPIDDRTLLQAGAFNAGLFAVDDSDEASAFLDWWAQLNATECTADFGDGSYDQKWLSLALCYFAGARIFRHPGYNVAHFNVDERGHVLSNGELRLFHYTLLHQFQWDVKNYMETLQLRENPALVSALHRYADLVRAKQHELETRFGITTARPGSTDDNDRSPLIRERYRKMFPSPQPIASRQECDDIKRQLMVDPATGTGG